MVFSLATNSVSKVAAEISKGEIPLTSNFRNVATRLSV